MEALRVLTPEQSMLTFLPRCTSTDTNSQLELTMLNIMFLIICHSLSPENSPAALRHSFQWFKNKWNLVSSRMVRIPVPAL